MKKKLKNWAVNNQEDEDGFSLNQYDVFIADRIKEKPGISSTINSTNSNPVAVKFTMISSKEKRYADKVSHFQDHGSINR